MFEFLKSVKKKSTPFFYISLLYVVFISELFAQPVNISGKVLSSRYAIKEASVTFIDNSDTTKKYIAVTDNSGKYELSVLVTSLDATETPLRNTALEQNYPNPFSTSTAICYKLRNQTDTRVTIYDILGREIKRFTLGTQNIGRHNVIWDGRNQFGQKIASGIYFYRLQAGSQSLVRKMVYNSDFNNLSGTGSALFSKENWHDDSNPASLTFSNFTIRIDNNENTMPYIIGTQLDNVTIKKDTTINFSVSYLPTNEFDFDSLRQIIRGFGASNILLWRPDMTDSEIETAFGTDNYQLGFSILRLMVEADKNRWSLYIPTAKKAYDMGATLIASPWYAPAEMVENVNGVDRVRHDMYEAYAAHLDSFVTYMNNNGVPLYAISIQNEPDITDQWTSWTSSEMFTFMKENAHAIHGTKVMAPESFHFSRDYSDPILNDSVACANTDIVGGHIYGSGLSYYPLAEQKGKEVWMTEYLINSGNPPADPDIDTGWSGAMQTAESINNCMNANMSAYVWWYIVRYYGPIADGTYAVKGNVTKKGYVMSQFSRFVRPGYHRVNREYFPPTSDVTVSAYRDTLTSREVIIAVNSSADEKEVVLNLKNNTQTVFTPYTTSDIKYVEQGEDININDNIFIMTLEPLSIITYVSQ